MGSLWCSCSISCLLLYPHFHPSSTRKGEGTVTGLFPTGNLWWLLTILGNLPWHQNICLLTFKAFLITISSTQRGVHHFVFTFRTSILSMLDPHYPLQWLLTLPECALHLSSFLVVSSMSHTIFSTASVLLLPAESYNWILAAETQLPFSSLVTFHSLLSTLLEFGLLFCGLLSYRWFLHWVL